MNFQIKKYRLFAKLIPILVWLGAVGTVVVLFQNQSGHTHLKGIAYSVQQTINTTETGYLCSVPVQLYQQVRQGDTLAVIKENTIAQEEYVNTLLHAQKETAEAELTQLKAELAAAEARLLMAQFEQGNEVTAKQSELAVDLEKARLQVLEINSVLEPDKLTLKDLEVEIGVVKNLVSEKVAVQYELQTLQSEHDVLAKRVKCNQELLAQAQEDYAAAQLRKDEFEQRLPIAPRLSDVELNPIRKAILVQEKKINELIEQRGIIVLTAPFDGIVSTLNCKSGQAVVCGDSIMTIIKPVADKITTWVPQEKMDQYTLDKEVQVISANAPYDTFVSQISNINASLEEMPQRLWKHPEIPEWGLPVEIPVQPDFACINNEIVKIKID